MGHLGRLKEAYRDLALRLERGAVGFPAPEEERAFEGFREVLEILFTPEEAALACRIPVRPTSLDRLALRVGIPEAELERRLEPMCDKGIVTDLVNPRTGRRTYLLSPPVVGFVEYSLMRAKDSIPKKRMAEALEAYTHGDPAFAREVFGRGTVIGRALVHEPALSPDLPEVLAFERATEVVGSSRRFAVSLCFCRHKAEHLGTRCEAPMENCLSLNGGAEFVLRRRFGREIERAEALDVLARSRAGGLVQIADNVKSRPAFLCNCCGCCCEQLQAVTRFGLPAVNPSGFVPRRRTERCGGCSRCARACPVGAIAMVPRRDAGRAKNALVPSIDEEVCIGCGVCAGACHKHAVAMERGGRTPEVPANAMERVVRQAVERNRLADLLFDDEGGAASRFLYRALDALVRLPPAQALLAREQVRSRFVDAAMRRFRRGPGRRQSEKSGGSGAGGGAR